MSRIATKRLTKELSDLQKDGCPDGCEILKADDLSEWVIAITPLGDSVFAGERFALRFRFSTQYPIEVPEVTFLTSQGFKAPEHPHIYSNGHICASILSSGWSPVLNVSSVLITMISMLHSCKAKSRPPGKF